MPSDDTLVNVAHAGASIPLVGTIIGTAVVVSGAFYLSQAGLRSDVRDILTRMDYQARLADTQTKLQNERFEALKSQVDALSREERLKIYNEVEDLRRQLQLARKGREP